MTKRNTGKKGFCKRLQLLAKSQKISHGAFRALVSLMLFADDEGRAWPALTTLAKAAALSRKGLMKILPTLEQEGFLKIERIKIGDKLPNGNTSRRQRSICRLSERVCGVPSTPIVASDSTPERRKILGE